MATQNQEDYLRALYILSERKGVLRSSDVASYMGVSKPSVSEMARRLNSEGFVKAAPYSKLKFTKKGKKLAEQLTSKHRIIELFLKKILKRDEEHLHEEAHRLEHAFSDESVERMRKLMGYPKTDPHGQPIPTIENR